MKKIIISLSGIILAVIAVAVIVFTVLPGLNDGYAIEAAGYTYDANGKNETFSKESIYNYAGLDGKPVIEDQGSSITLNDGRIIFLDDSSVQLLSNSVAIVDKNNLLDLESKSILSNEEDAYSVGKKDSDKKLTQLPKGSIVKLNKGQYLVLDGASMENGKDYSKQYDTEMIYVSIDKNKRVRVFTNGSYDETISEAMYLKLNNNTCKFQLKDEELVCENEKNNIDLANITVKFNDAGEDKSLKEEEEKKQASKEAKDTEDLKDTGNGSGKQNEDLPEIVKIEEKNGYQVPIIDAQVETRLNSLKGSLRISDPEARLTSLAVVLRDASGNEVMRKGVPIKADEDTFTFKDLEYQKDYVVSIEGAYKGENDKSVSAVFYRKLVNFNELLFDAAIVETSAESITLSLKGDFSELSTVSINYKLNNGTASTGSNKQVDVSAFQLDADNRVTITGLQSNSSYLLSYADVKTKANASVTSNWYAVGNTRKKLPVVGVSEATYDGARQIFKMKIDPFTDIDDSVTSVRYVAYLKSEFDVNGVNAPEKLSASQSGSEKFKELTVSRTSGMQTGDYIFVAFVSGNDTQETYVLEATPSSTVSINAAKNMPTATFELKKATTSELRVKHIISDVDNTLVFNGIDNPTVEVYALDGSGDITGSALKTISINSRTDITMTQLFDGLVADTDYRIVARGQANLDDGLGDVNFEATSDIYRTMPIVPLNATFNLVDVTANSITINTKIADSDKSLVSAILQVTNLDDNTVETVSLTKAELQVFYDAAGDVRDILSLDPATNYRIDFANAKDSGNNIIPINGSIDVLTAQIKVKPSVEFVNFIEKASTIQMIYKVTDADAALIFAPNDYPVFEIYEVLAGGVLASTPTDSAQFTQMNGAELKIQFKNLTKLTDYKVVFKGSYDINVFGGIVTQGKLGESNVVTTTDVQDVIATITDNVIDYTSINFNVKLSNSAIDLASGKISIYEKYGSTPVDTIDISGDFATLIATGGVNYNFTGLKKATSYVIKIESLSDGVNITNVIGGTFEFDTKKAKEKPTASFEWNKTDSSDTQLNVLYEVSDVDNILQLSTGVNTAKAHLYEVNAQGELGVLVQTVRLTTPAELNGEFVFANLTPNKEYKVVIKGSYDQEAGDGMQNDIILGVSETMLTRNSLIVQAYFSEVSKTTTSATIGVVLIDNLTAFANGTASLQVYDTSNHPVGAPIVLSADQMTRLSLGTRIDVLVSGLAVNTNYSIKFLDAKNQATQDLSVHGSLQFKTDKIKDKPTVLFSETLPTASKVTTKFSVVDADQTMVVTNDLKTIVKLQIKDGSGNYSDVSGKQFEYATFAELLNRGISFSGLENNRDYRMVVTSWYMLGDASTLKFEPIGTLDFKTTPNDVITANVEVNEPLTSLDAGSTAIQFETHTNSLASGKVQLTNKDGVPVGNPINITQADFVELSTSGKNYDWSLTTINSALQPNTQYNIVFLNVVDDGNNAVTIISNPTGFKTRKLAPETDIVQTSIKRDGTTTNLEAIIGLAPTLPFKDTNSAVKEITYKIYSADDLDTDLETIKVTNANDFTSVVKFTISKPTLGVGRSYVVKAEIIYHDNYEDDVINVQSAIQEVKRELPIIKYEVISRNAATTTFKVVVSDVDQSIYGNLELLADTTSYPLIVGENTIMVSNAATAFKSEADIARLDGTTVDLNVELQKTVLQKAVNDVPAMTTSITYDKTTYSLKYKPTATTALGAIFAKYKVSEDVSNEVVINKTASGTTTFAEQSVALPTDNIFFGSTYDFTSDNKVVYTQHGMNNTFNGTYILALNSASASTSYVSTSSSVVGLNTRLSSGSVYKIHGGSYQASTGDYIDATLVNEASNKSISVDMGRLVESDSAASIDFKLQGNGSYKVMVGGAYASFENGTVTVNAGTASLIDLYKVDDKTFALGNNVVIHALTKPKFEVTNLQVLDISVSFNYLGKDPDTTLLKNTVSKLYDTKIILENMNDHSMKEVSLEYLSKNGMMFTGLKSNQEYKMTIVGNYNLKDGNPDVMNEVLYETSFTTAVTLPTATKSTYVWDPIPYRNVDTTAKLTYADPGNLAKTIEYVYYKAPAGSYDVNNLEAMKLLLEQNAANKEAKEFSFPVADNASNQAVSLPMFNTKWNEPRNYGINNYLVAAYITTDVPGAGRILVNVNKLNVTQPVLNKAVFSNTSTTETTATTKFTFEDPNLVLGNGTRNFEVSLYKRESNGTYTLVPGSTKLETRTTTNGFIDVNYTGLDPNTNYRMEVKSTTYNDLVVIGSKSYTVDMKTLNQYITSSIVKTAVTTSRLTASVDDIVANDAVIQTMEMKLYYWPNEAAMAGPATLMETKPFMSPFPANVSHPFALTQTGLYYVEFNVTYSKNAGGGNDIYTKQSIVREVSVGGYALDVSRRGNVLKLTDSVKNQDIEEVIVKDQDTVIATIPYEEFANSNKQSVVLDTASEIKVEVKDVAGKTSTIYASDDVVGQVNAISLAKNKTMLKSGDFINKKDIFHVEVTRPLDWWESIQSFFGSDFAYTSDIVAGDLNDGIILPYNLKDVEIKITDKDGNQIHTIGGK